MPRNVMRHLIGAALVALLASPVAAARDKDKGPKGKGHKHHGRDTTEWRTTTADRERERARPRDEVVVIDRDGHRRIITDYFSREGLPPGLAKRQSLPPGLAKQLRERGRLPPGLQKRLTPVPPPLTTRLPAAPPYYSRYFVGRDLVIVDRRTQRIAAIIPGVVPG